MRSPVKSVEIDAFTNNRDEFVEKWKKKIKKKLSTGFHTINSDNTLPARFRNVSPLRYYPMGKKKKLIKPHGEQHTNPAVKKIVSFFFLALSLSLSVYLTLSRPERPASRLHFRPRERPVITRSERLPAHLHTWRVTEVDAERNGGWRRKELIVTEIKTPQILWRKCLISLTYKCV